MLQTDRAVKTIGSIQCVIFFKPVRFLLEVAKTFHTALLGDDWRVVQATYRGRGDVTVEPVDAVVSFVAFASADGRSYSRWMTKSAELER